MNSTQARGQSPLSAIKTAADKKKSVNIIHCSKCNIGFSIDKATFIGRIIEGEEGLKEYGLECPNCSEWYHSYFLSKDLERPTVRNRKERRAYAVKFDKFQKRMRAKMGLRLVEGRWVKDNDNSQSD